MQSVDVDKSSLITFRDIANENRMSPDILKQTKEAKHITSEQYGKLTALLAAVGRDLTQYEACGMYDLIWRAINRMLEDIEKEEESWRK